MQKNRSLECNIPKLNPNLVRKGHNQVEREPNQFSKKLDQLQSVPTWFQSICYVKQMVSDLETGFQSIRPDLYPQVRSPCLPWSNTWEDSTSPLPHKCPDPSDSSGMPEWWQQALHVVEMKYLTVGACALDTYGVSDTGPRMSVFWTPWQNS